MSRKLGHLNLLLTVMLFLCGRALASSTATISVSGSEQPGDSNTVTVSFNGFVETVHYGQYSTPASIASAFGAMFSRDYLRDGLCASASGSTITFKLKGSAPFGILDITGSTSSFQLTSSGFASQVSKTVDVGTVTLTVGGVVAATTNYGDEATPSSIAEGLAANTAPGSLVSVTAVDAELNLQAKQTGATTNYSYTLQTTSYDTTDFSQPSFANPPLTGNLSGGANASSGQGQQTLYSYSIPSYSSASQPTGYDAVGNVVGYKDSVMGGWSFGYDTLNRLQSGSASTGTYAGLQTSWGYDAFGNRTSENFSGNSNVLLPTSSSTFYNANNRISSSSLGSPQYDASGGVIVDNQNQYLYDGDGRMCAVRSLVNGAMTGYIYGADGTRVSTGTITTWGSCDPSTNGYQALKDSILGPSGGQLTETGVDVNGNVTWAHTNVWVGGQLLATYDPNGLHFYLSDWTGSRRVQTDYEGVVEQTCTNLPYGDGVSCAATPDEELYAGLERDSESGLDHAIFRQYSSTFGRWTTPDPYGGSANGYNPQSLNRYAYGNGNPLGVTDPSGLDPFFDLFLYFNGSSSTVTVTASSELLGDLLGPFILAADIYEFGKDFGWWGGGPTFHGNVAASQKGKYVPTAPQDGFADCGCIAGQGLFHSPQAQQTWNAAAGAVSPQGIAAWYTASAVGAAGALGIGAVGGAAELTTLGLESPSTFAMLEAHVETATDLAFERGLTEAQAAAGPNLEAANMGTNIHTIAQGLVENDPLLGNIRTTGPFEFGPDFYSPQTGQWWDITTQNQWLAHVAKYTARFGVGTFLGY